MSSAFISRALIKQICSPHHHFLFVYITSDVGGNRFLWSTPSVLLAQISYAEVAIPNFSSFCVCSPCQLSYTIQGIFLDYWVLGPTSWLVGLHEGFVYWISCRCQAFWWRRNSESHQETESWVRGHRRKYQTWKSLPIACRWTSRSKWRNYVSRW